VFFAILSSHLSSFFGSAMALTVTGCLERGPATSAEIQIATGLSQTAVARQLRAMGDSVIRLDKSRPPRYVMTCNAFGGDDNIPLIMVNAHGNTMVAADVRPLAHGGFIVQPRTGMPRVLLGEGGEGLYDDLPYFLSDLRPQGFLGRQVAEEMATQSDDFPSDPRRWNASHVGRYLLSNGDDLPGNFKFGQQTNLRIRRPLIATTVEDYPALANNVMSGVIPNSSAGGEQPKFTTYCSERSTHVIVKFSPQGNSDVARRWRDILITEFHATEVLHSVDITATETRLIESGNRIFLESKRFDRHGEYGRSSMLSLESVDAEFTGIGGTWHQVMNALLNARLVSPQYVFDAEFLWVFGRFINNTDMHLGNLSLSIDGDVFGLLPVYDMCSMGFAPKGGGEVAPYDFKPTEITGSVTDESILSMGKSLAHDFWQRVTGDSRISDEFREYLDRGNPVDRM